MTDMHSKRKYAGEPHKDIKRAKAPDVERLPPHKKPKTWALTIEWTEVTTRKRFKRFTSKAARDEARVRCERYFREEAEKAKAQKTKRYRYDWRGYFNSPIYGFEEVELNEVKTGPTYYESYEDSSLVSETAHEG